MSKIDNAISEIKNFLAGQDHSNNPQISQAAKFYAQAGAETARQLEECRKLIEQGLLIDAQQINNAMHPTLVERAETLNNALTPEEFSNFCDICRMYQYTVPQKLDIKTVAVLRSNSSEQAMDNLVLRWRKIARTHNTQAKVKLLREILATDPAGKKMWQSNLLNIEQQWITELMAEAEKALAAGEGEKLIAYYQALTDPELIAPPSAAVLKKFQGLIDATRQQQFDAGLNEKRNQLFSAYSMSDDAMAKVLLSEYDFMKENPLFQEDPEAERAVDEVRNFIKDRIAARKLERQFQEKCDALTQALDEHKDFAEVENLYEALRRMDLPIDERLSIRVKNRSEEHNSEMRRKHVRKCVYSIILLILLVAILGGGFFVLQNYRTYRNYYNEMNSLMENKNYAGIINLHQEITENTPVLLRFGSLSGIKQEAEKKLEEQKQRHAKIADLCSEAELELQKAEPSIQVLRLFDSKLKELPNDDLTPELNQRSTRISQYILQKEQEYKDRLEEEFAQRISQPLAELKKCSEELYKSQDLAALSQRINIAFKSARDLLDNPGEVSAETINSYKKLLESYDQSLMPELRRLEKRRQALDDLTKPVDSKVYLTALEKLPETAPDLAEETFQQVYNDLPITTNILASIRLSTTMTTPEDLQKQLEALNITPQNNVFVSDCRKLLPPSQTMKKELSIMLDKLKNELSASFDYYEIIFADANDSRYYFYTATKPRMQKRSTDSTLKAMQLQVVVNPANDPQDFRMAVQTRPNEFDGGNTSDGYIFIWQRPLDNVNLPETKEFTQLLNMPLNQPLPVKARHYIVLQQLISDLEKCTVPDKLELIVLQYLNSIATDERMNVYAKARLCGILLELLKSASHFYPSVCSGYLQKLNDIGLHKFEQWYQPDIQIKNPEMTARLQDFFSNLDTALLKNTERQQAQNFIKALDRGLEPAGVVLKKEQGKYSVHLFKYTTDAKEMWFYLPYKDSGEQTHGWYIVPERSIKKNGELYVPQLDLPNGIMFFTPTDGEDTFELARRYRQQYPDQFGSTVEWPQSWPVNAR